MIGIKLGQVGPRHNGLAPGQIGPRQNGTFLPQSQIGPSHESSLSFFKSSANR